MQQLDQVEEEERAFSGTFQYFSQIRNLGERESNDKDPIEEEERGKHTFSFIDNYSNVPTVNEKDVSCRRKLGMMLTQHMHGLGNINEEKWPCLAWV